MSENGSQLVDRRFVLLGRLGRGGMASAYRAFDGRRLSRVVVKAIAEAGPWRRGHPVEQEFEAWAPLDHPAIVRALELRVAAEGPLAPGTPYLVLEEVAGRTFAARAKEGSLDTTSLRVLAVRMLSALARVHADGWVHRDVKPANLLGPSPATAKLTDLGLAVPIGHRDGVGVLSGSLPYAAPESVLGRPVDARTDLYALGVTLCRLAAGPLWREPPAAWTIAHHVAGRPLPGLDRVLRRLGDRVLGSWVRSLLEVRPEHRPFDACAAARALTGSEPQEPAAATPKTDGLRLELDRARLGAWRTIRAPACRRASTIARLRVWCGALGLPLVDLAERISDDPRDRWLEALAGLLTELGTRGAVDAGVARRARALPLLECGSRWIPDRAAPVGGVEPAAVAATILAVGGLLPVAWHVPVSLDDPFSRCIRRRVARACARPFRGRIRGGVLWIEEASVLPLGSVAEPESHDALQECAV